MSEGMILMDFTELAPDKDGVQIWTLTRNNFMWDKGMRASGCCVAPSWASYDIGVRDAYTWEAWRESGY